MLDAGCYLGYNSQYGCLKTMKGWINMIDLIKYDFIRAESLRREIKTFEENFIDLYKRNEGRVTGAGTWWKGIAYEAYSNTFSGAGGRSTKIAECPRYAGRVCTFLKVASQRKSDFEKYGAKYFT